MSYKVIKTTSHEQWLDERKKGVGSSEAGTIMGVNHFDTPYKLWRRKTGIDLPVEQNEAMEMGHHLEPAVATLFAARTGAIIKKSSEGDWLAVDTKRDTSGCLRTDSITIRERSLPSPISTSSSARPHRWLSTRMIFLSTGTVSFSIRWVLWESRREQSHGYLPILV